MFVGRSVFECVCVRENNSETTYANFTRFFCISLVAVAPSFSGGVAIHGGPKKPRYDTRCYFNVRSKADASQLNLPHETKKWKSGSHKVVAIILSDLNRLNFFSLEDSLANLQ